MMESHPSTFCKAVCMSVFLSDVCPAEQGDGTCLCVWATQIRISVIVIGNHAFLVHLSSSVLAFFSVKQSPWGVAKHGHLDCYGHHPLHPWAQRSTFAWGWCVLVQFGSQANSDPVSIHRGMILLVWHAWDRYPFLDWEERWASPVGTGWRVDGGKVVSKKNCMLSMQNPLRFIIPHVRGGNQMGRNGLASWNRTWAWAPKPPPDPAFLLAEKRNLDICKWETLLTSCWSCFASLGTSWWHIVIKDRNTWQMMKLRTPGGSTPEGVTLQRGFWVWKWLPAAEHGQHALSLQLESLTRRRRSR